MSDAGFVEQLAGARPIVELAHGRQRTEGVVGVAWRDGAVVAICAHRCGLQAVPDGLAGLAQLERLDVGGNQLAALPPLPPLLRQLYVDDNQLVRLPALPRLSVLDANRNRLEALPALADLDFAYLATNRLTRLPAITGVRYLNIGGNPLGQLALDDAAIRELRAEQAQLHTLSIDRLAGLRELSLRGNDLVTLPDELARLTQLRVLDLRGNQLDTLPEALRSLPLTKLDLRWNPLRTPPRWLGELTERGCLVYT
jgi:Leucine-rich repeat (LRR) protein